MLLFTVSPSLGITLGWVWRICIQTHLLVVGRRLQLHTAWILHRAAHDMTSLRGSVLRERERVRERAMTEVTDFYHLIPEGK